MNLLTKSFILIFLLPGIYSFAQSGCTDYQATNFDPSAIINDGSCIYPYTSLPLTLKCYIDSIETGETSGIVKQDNNLWTHVDDTYNIIYRIDTLTDSILQRVTINNSSNIDWEDISSDSSHIYIGDVGNNDGNRANLKFYKILQSEITDSSSSVNASTINFSYSDQTNFNVSHNNNFYDCEAFFILNDSIHMFTKGWVNKWTKHYVLSADTGIHVAQLVDSFNVGGLITSAAIQGDSLVVLLGLNFSGGNNCFVWMLRHFEGSRFFSGNKRKFSIGGFFIAGQAEGICFKDANRGYISNEQFGSIRSQLRVFDLHPYLTPAPPVPAIATSANTIYQNLQACTDSANTTFTIWNSSVSVGQDLYFSIGGLAPWVTATPISDTLAPGDSAVITLSFMSGTMTGGAYNTNISILSNDPYRPVQNVSVTLNVNYNPCLDFTFTSDTCNGVISFTTTSINTPTNYFWDFGDGDTSVFANPSHPYSVNGNYVAGLIGCNAYGCDTVIQNVQAMLHGPISTNCYPVTQSYCCGIGITNFKISAPSLDVINNSSNDAIAAYEDFTCMSPGTMITNYHYNLVCTTATTFSEYLKVWLDMNNDGMLDSVSEELFFDLNTVAPVHQGTITIPALPTNVYGIPLRMRVASDYQQIPFPCLNPQSGQHEDYSIILNFSTDVKNIYAAPDFKIFPNPFTQTTNIEYTLLQHSHVRLDVFNLLGERVAVVVDSQMQTSGNYLYQFSENPPGIYFVKLSVNENTFIKKIVKTI